MLVAVPMLMKLDADQRIMNTLKPNAASISVFVRVCVCVCVCVCHVCVY